MGNELKTSKDLFHEALEAVSLHVGDMAKTVYTYELTHLGNALVVGVEDGWASIRSAVSMIDFHRITLAAGHSISQVVYGMACALADYMEANSITMTYKVNGDTENSFVWAYENKVYIGSTPYNARNIWELTPLDFYGLMDQAGVCLLRYPDKRGGDNGEYAIVSKKAD